MKYNLRIAKVDPEELKIGIEIELEHTDNREMAKKIAIDHLAESPKYYTYLVEMEKKMPKTAEKANNPWAICTKSVGKEDKEKYESCVMDVKKEFNLSKKKK